MRRRFRADVSRTALIAAVMMLIASPGLAAGLPNGATALNETFSDWTVNCRVAGTDEASKPACVLQQVQLQQQTRKRILSVSFVPQQGGGLKGSIVLPFGLDLQNGVKLRIDNGDPTAAIPFKTCFPIGCMIPIDWKAATADTLRAATALKIETRSVDGKDMPFSVSLKGFGGALDRVVALTAGE